MLQYLRNHLDVAFAMRLVEGRWISHNLFGPNLVNPVGSALRFGNPNQLIFENESAIEQFLDSDDKQLHDLQLFVRITRKYLNTIVMTLDELYEVAADKGVLQLAEGENWAESLAYARLQLHDGYSWAKFDPLWIFQISDLVSELPANDIFRFNYIQWLAKGDAVMRIARRQIQGKYLPIAHTWDDEIARKAFDSMEQSFRLLIVPTDGSAVMWLSTSRGTRKLLDPLVGKSAMVYVIDWELTNTQTLKKPSRRSEEHSSVVPLDISAAA